MKTTFSFSLLSFHLNLRRELRFALLAAMETCWVYSILALIAALMGLAHAISPLSLFVAYWIALIVGRVLPQRKEHWVFLQIIAIGIAIVTMITVARIELYTQSDLLDFSWLPHYAIILFSFTHGIVAEHLAATGVLYAFIRGLGFGQRPMTLWFTAFQFRLGIVVFFLLFILSAILRPFDPTVWLFSYFFVSLLAIALARIDEMESDVRFGPRWAITLLASVALVLFLGLILLQFLTLDSAAAVLQFFAPLGAIGALIIALIALPFGFVASWLIDLLRPLFTSLGQFFHALQGRIPTGATDSLQAQDQASQLSFLAPILKTLFVLTIVLTVGYLVANSLNRRMKQIEDERYFRESLSESERRAERGSTRNKKTPTRRHAGSLAAESIRRIYAALITRAGEAGLPRAVAETPYEYLPRLESAWPDHAADLHAITDAYVDVHYGEREFAATEVHRLRELWKRLERTLERSSVQTSKR